MKVIIDNSNLFAGGGIQVACSFLYDLLEINDDNEYYVIQSPNCASQLNAEIFDSRFTFFNIEQLSVFKRIKVLKEIEFRVNPNVIFTTFGPSYHQSRVPKIVGFALGQILYPSSPFFSKISFIDKSKVRLISYIKSYFFTKNSDVLIYETEDARQIYSRLINNKIIGYTVSNTLNSIFNKSKDWKEIFITKSNFDIVYLTANYPHKNLEIIPFVIDELISSGQISEFKFHISIIKDELKFEDKYSKYINYLGKVAINQVPNLYKEMDLLFMPTLLETFSTSYLEAMASEVPIIASDLGFSRDICGDAALFVEPLDAKGYASAILKIKSDLKLRQTLISKGKINLKRFGSSMDRTLKYLEIIKKHSI